MNQYKDFLYELGHIIDTSSIEEKALMKDYTSFKVGGPADLMIMPKNFEEVQKILTLCRENKLKYVLLGNGSNLLVKDGGIRGIVIRLCQLNAIQVEGDRIIAQSGATLSDVAGAALEAGLTGFEFACGIPGTIGGGLTMNAGAYDGEMSKVVESALVINEVGEIVRLSKAQLELSYRMSAIIKYGYTVLEVVLKLEPGEKEAIQNKMEELNQKRREKQPLEYASAGSTFKRPEGYFAGKLIQDSGLKGYHIGDAQVSEKHSGFIINRGSASAKEVLELIAYVQQQVKEKFQVDLHTEVRIIGEE